MKEIVENRNSIPIEALVNKALGDYQARESHKESEIIKSNRNRKSENDETGRHQVIIKDQKRRNEQDIQLLLEKLLADLEPYQVSHPAGFKSPLDLDAVEKAAFKTLVTGFILEIDNRKLLLDRPFLKFFIERGYLDVAEDFMIRAKKDEPDLTNEEIFQALRNVWIMNSLQLLWDLPLEITPSVYSYSLLYPYTDNFLDDPLVETKDKVKFNQHLSEVLAGREVEPLNETEAKVFYKIRQIETQYSRTEFPQVFESIRLIQEAQTASLQQDDPATLSKEAILKLSFFKGGTSVLADAFLVKGSLSSEEMEFAFAYGAFLQLLDDFQDTHLDELENHQTLFSFEGDPEVRSFEIQKLIRYIFKANAPNPKDTEMMSLMKEVISSCTMVMIMDAAGRNPSLITSTLYNELEEISRVSLPFYKDLEGRLKACFNIKE